MAAVIKRMIRVLGTWVELGGDTPSTGVGLFTESAASLTTESGESIDA